MNPDEVKSEISGFKAAESAWRKMLCALPETAPHQLWLVDAAFVDWPLGEVGVIEALTRWARLPSRRMVWIGEDYAALARRHPRLANWRREFAHVVAAFCPAEGERFEWPSWLLADRTAVMLTDRVHALGRTVSVPSELQIMREAVDALLQRCEPAWPAQVLGL